MKGCYMIMCYRASSSYHKGQGPAEYENTQLCKLEEGRPSFCTGTLQIRIPEFKTTPKETDHPNKSFSLKKRLSLCSDILKDSIIWG